MSYGLVERLEIFECGLLSVWSDCAEVFVKPPMSGVTKL